MNLQPNIQRASGEYMYFRYATRQITTRALFRYPKETYHVQAISGPNFFLTTGCKALQFS